MEKIELNIHRRLASIILAAVLMLLLVPVQAEAVVLPDPPGRSSTGIDPMGDNLGGPSYVDIRMAVISQRTDPLTVVELKISLNGALPDTPPADACLALAWAIDADANPATGSPFNDIGADFAFVLFGIGASNPCSIAPPIPIGVYSLWLLPFFEGPEPFPLPADIFSIRQRIVTIRLPLGLPPGPPPPGITFFWVAVSVHLPGCLPTVLCDIAPDTGHVTHTAI